MIRIIVSSRSRPFFLGHKLAVFKEESRSPAVEAEWKSSLDRREGII